MLSLKIKPNLGGKDVFIIWQKSTFLIDENSNTLIGRIENWQFTPKHKCPINTLRFSVLLTILKIAHQNNKRWSCFILLTKTMPRLVSPQSWRGCKQTASSSKLSEKLCTDAFPYSILYTHTEIFPIYNSCMCYKYTVFLQTVFKNNLNNKVSVNTWS